MRRVGGLKRSCRRAALGRHPLTRSAGTCTPKSGSQPAVSRSCGSPASVESSRATTVTAARLGSQVCIAEIAVLAVCHADRDRAGRAAAERQAGSLWAAAPVMTKREPHTTLKRTRSTRHPRAVLPPRSLNGAQAGSYWGPQAVLFWSSGRPIGVHRLSYIGP